MRYSVLSSLLCIHTDLQAARAARKPGKYFLGNFGSYQFDNNASQASEVFLAYDIAEAQNTLITLSINADSVKYIVNRSETCFACWVAHLFIQYRSPGVINLAFVDNFVAFSGTGKLTVLVTNTGFLNAQYTVWSEYFTLLCSYYIYIYS